MATQVQNVNKLNAGLCPHGLPPGACPICSNMGGGGSMRAGERAQKSGEMSYHQCVMLGNLMKARELADKRHAQMLEQRAENIKNFENLMTKLSTNLIQFTQQFSSNLLMKPLVLVAQNIALPILNFVRNIPTLVTNLSEKMAQFKEKFIDITDKLTAILGEAKAFIEKKVSELISTIKSKLQSIFKIFKKHNAKDDDTKIDDDKKIFNLKTILHKINIKLKRKKDKKHE